MKLTKYTFRRLALGVVIVPLVASAWFLFYALLVGAGAGATNTPSGVFTDGLWIGVMATLALAFWEQIEYLFEKWGL
jgi:hypothetical protein